MTTTQPLSPGPELDLLVSAALGMTPCDEWLPWGTPGRMLKTCVHAEGACYPATQAPPSLSDDDSPFRMRLRFFPNETSVQKGWGSCYVVMLGGVSIVGETEAHALCLAYLYFREHLGVSAFYAKDTLWEGFWKQTAVLASLVDVEPKSGEDLPSPWTPEMVCCIGKAIQIVRRDVLMGRVVAASRAQKWLWKLSAGLQSEEAMARVVSILERVEAEPESFSEVCGR